MRRTDNYASNQIKLLLGELSSSSHNDKKKAITTFQTYVQTYQPEIADETVDFLFTGCLNGKLGTGLLFWGGATSGSGANAHLKRICRHVVQLIRWLVTHESESERGNFYYTRFIRLQIVDLKQLNIPRHVAENKKKKRKPNELDENENIFILTAILLNEHRNAQGKIAKLDIDELLLFDEDAHHQYNEWVNSGAIEQIPNYLGDKHREEVIDRPARWDEVIFKCIPLQEGEEDTTEVEEEKDVIPPIPDPLGISSVDLRSIQASYAQGRLMKSQTGQLARRSSTNVMPIEGAAPTGARKTSFRSSTTFAPFINDNDDSENDDSDEDDLVGDNNNNSDRVSANTRSNAETMRTGFGVSNNGDLSGGQGQSGKNGEAEDPRGTLARSASTVAREKKIIASVVPSDKNFSTTLFLTLVHGSVSFNQLRAGQDHLQQHLMLQSSRRENLVRLHFGLFVQCAEGLEFLKAYRKGVLKGNEMRNRRGSNARKSIANAEEMKNKSTRGNNKEAAGDGKDKPIAISSADKGLERLRRSQTTLDAAKVEAQRTLAPILERMKQSRRIKSAEKVLKRMTAILEYPMRMRTALEKGDLSEVVAIYQRVQAVPTSSSSLRIMHKIKEAANLVITDLKKQCYTVLLSPTANYATLLRYGKIMSDLDGEGAYLELLRQCMIRQILHFVESVKTIRDKFCADCADANDKGLEQNLLRRSPFLAGNSLLNQDNRESIGTLVRRHADANTSRRRLNSKHLGSDGGGSDGGNRSRTQSESLVGGAWGDSDAMDFRENNRDEFALDQEDSDRDWLDEDDDGDDDFIDGNMDDLDFLDDIASSPGNSGRNGSKKALKFEGLEGDSVDDEDNNSNARAAVRRGSADINHSVLLCALVRQGYVEAMVDLLAKWFPCMFRLVATLANASAGSTTSHAPPPVALLRNTSSKPTAATSGQANSTLAAKSPAPATYVNLNRGAIAPARILGAALKVYSDHVKQVISGVESSFSTLTLPSELNSAFNEVDSYVSALHYPIASVAPVVMTLTTAVRYDNKMYDAIASSILINPLREPFHREALQEVYDLYNAMEFIMKREAAVVASNLLASSGSTNANGTAVGSSGIAGANAGASRVPFGASAAGNKNNTLNFLSPTSPYYDAMNTLQALSKEGEMALAQKIMDRLMELSATLHTFMVGDNIDQHRAAVMGGSSNGGYAGYGLARLGNSTGNSDKNNLSTQSVTDLVSPGKTRRRGSMMLEEELNAVVAQNNIINKNSSAANGAAAGNKVGMENNVSELSDLIMRCLKSLRQKVKREEWVAVVVQEGVQKVFSSFAEALRRESLRVSEGSGASSGSGGGATGTRGRNSIPNTAPQQRGRRSGAGNLRSSIGNGLVIETLEEELRFGDADSYKACVQLDLLRACVALRCNCVPFIGNEMKLVFAVTEGRDKNQPPKDTQGSVTQALATLNLNDANARGGDKVDKAPLNRTKSSLMTKLFQTDTKEDHTPPPPPAGLIDSPNRPLSLSLAQSNNNSTKNKKLALIDMLKMSIKSNQVDGLQQNLREIIAIEDSAAGTYISLKTKEIRTTIFAGYALLVHSEEHNMWVPLPGGGATARVPVHLVRVLLSLGNERKKLAESLGELKVLRGYNAGPEGELQIEVVQAPVPTPAPATRSLFSSVDPDSGSESDSGRPTNNDANDAKTVARRAYCEALLYRDYLYKQLCVGLLQNYQDLIKRLRTNTFHDAVTEAPSATTGVALNIPQRRMNNREMFTSLTEVDNETESSEDEAGGVRTAKMPFCLGQAVEEYNYLMSLLTPLLDNDPAVSYQENLSALDRARHQAQDKLVQRFCGKQFASTTQLTQSGRMYAMMINGKNFM